LWQRRAGQEHGVRTCFARRWPPDDDDVSAALVYYLRRITAKLLDGAAILTLLDMQDVMDLAYCDYFRFMSGGGSKHPGPAGRWK
jgi:hypothetical protein